MNIAVPQSSTDMRDNEDYNYQKGCRVDKNLTFVLKDVYTCVCVCLCVCIYLLNMYINTYISFIYMWSEVAQSCSTLCDPMDCSLSGFSIHGIFQARVLKWIAIYFSRGPSQPRNRTRVSWLAGKRFTVGAIRSCLNDLVVFLTFFNTSLNFAIK